MKRNEIPEEDGGITLVKDFAQTKKELAKELKKFGIEVSYSTKLIIREAAMTDYILRRMERYIGTIIHHYLKPNEHGYWDAEYGKENFAYFGEDFIILQKRLIFLLNELGLSPKQQIMREKFKIISKLDKKLFEIKTKDLKYNLNAIHEKEVKI